MAKKKKKKPFTQRGYKAKKGRRPFPSLNRRNYDDPRYKSWRKRVYQRDGYKCRWPGCCSGDKRLNAHHIKKWASFPLMRFIVSNGITLCKHHHESIRGKEELYEKFFVDILSQSLIRKLKDLGLDDDEPV